MQNALSDFEVPHEPHPLAQTASSSSSVTKRTSVSVPTCQARLLQSAANIKPSVHMASVGLDWKLQVKLCFVWEHQRGRDRVTAWAGAPQQHPARGEIWTQSLIAALSNFLLQQEEIIKLANVNVNGRYMTHNCPVNCLFAAESLSSFWNAIFIPTILRCSSCF